jgi:hypothetical protein
MWSLTSPRAERTSGPEKFRRSVKKDFFNTIRHERTSAVVPKNIPESLTLRMLYPAFSHERQEDIGPFG